MTYLSALSLCPLNMHFNGVRRTPYTRPCTEHKVYCDRILESKLLQAPQQKGENAQGTVDNPRLIFLGKEACGESSRLSALSETRGTFGDVSASSPHRLLCTSTTWTNFSLQTEYLHRRTLGLPENSDSGTGTSVRTIPSSEKAIVIPPHTISESA